MLNKYSLLVFVFLIKLCLAAEPEPLHFKLSDAVEVPVDSNEPRESDVIDLTDEIDFNASLSRYSVVLVEFFAPWCGYCQALEPEYDNASVQLKANDSPITLAKVNCGEKPLGEDKCKAVGVPSLPTLKVFKNGEYYYDYKGERTAAGIVEFMNRILGDASKHFEKPEQLDTPLANTPDVTVFGLFENSCADSQLVKDFHSAADILRFTVPFVHVFVDRASDAKRIKILKEFFRKNLEVKPCNVILVRPIQLRNKFEPDYVVHSSGNIIEFVERHKHGLVGHKTLDNKFEFDLPLVNVFYDVNFEKNPKTTKYWRNRVLKVADKHRDITFVIANKNAFYSEMESLGLKPKLLSGDSTPIVAARNEIGKKFVMGDNFTVEAFAKFVVDFKKGKIVPYVTSQELPVDNDNADVKVLVAYNFEDMIFNVDKDHMILFYNPNDEKCKEIEPHFQQLGEEMRNEADVQISKIDATVNDILTTFPFRGYPTVYLYRKNKTITLYEGEGILKDMIEFLSKQATNELIGFDRNANKVVDVKEEL